jgi:hypothetical protein
MAKACPRDDLLGPDAAARAGPDKFMNSFERT